MKLPKNFGGQGFSGAIQQARQAMERAKHLDEELALERVAIDKGPIKAVFAGTGEIVSISIDPSVIDPDDKDGLEDLLLSVIRDGFVQTNELRNNRVRDIMPNVPGLGSLGL